MKEKETHWLRRVVIPLHHEVTKESSMGIWRVIGSTRLQNLAVRSVCVFNSTPSGYAQCNRAHQHPEGGCAASNCCPGLEPSQRNLYQVYVPLVHTQLMGLSNAGSCVGPVWSAVPSA
eukprot:1150858-Pelagomonas_calceolata.AAC.4